jgi:hypothetical protein
MLLNVGSGGGAAAAPTAGGAPAAGGAAPAEEAKEEAKEEGTLLSPYPTAVTTDNYCREGRVRRRHGLRSLRLNIHNISSPETHRDINHILRCTAMAPVREYPLPLTCVGRRKTREGRSGTSSAQLRLMRTTSRLLLPQCLSP